MTNIARAIAATLTEASVRRAKLLGDHSADGQPWHILLAMYAYDRPVSLESLTFSPFPSATRRWLSFLVENQHVIVADEMFELTPSTRKIVEDHLLELGNGIADIVASQGGRAEA